MNCPRCSHPLVEGADFCGQCGAPLHAQAAVTVAPAVPAQTKRIAFIAGAGFIVFLLLMCNFILALVEVGSVVGLVLSIIAAIMPAVFYSALVISLDRNEREPTMVLLGAFLWGALVATLFAWVMNTAFGTVMSLVLGPQAGTVLTAGISAPIVEESSKGAAVLLLFLFLRDEFDNVLDGIVYGSLVGIGFAMTENIIYFGRAYQQGQLLALGVLFYLRAILGGLGHAAYTGFTGAGFGFSRETNSKVWKIAAPVGGYVIAMFSHSMWNFVGATLIPAIVGNNEAVYLLVVAPLTGLIFTAPPILTLLVMVFFAWRREARIVREQLLDEANAAVITMDEYQRLSSIRRRVGAELQGLTRKGIRHWYHLTQLHHAATELAFRKWHLSRGERPKRAQKQTSEEFYRRRIIELRARL